jgi:hypothetical protein
VPGSFQGHKFHEATDVQFGVERAMKPGRSSNASSMDKRILFILAGVIAVLVIAVGVEIGIDTPMTTGIDLNLNAE